jgi:condensation domain-containing protein
MAQPAETGSDPAGESILVQFEGDRTGVEELSWGQRELWVAMREQHSWLPIGAVQPVPAGTTVDDALADLRFVMSSYPSMRTRLRLGPGDYPKQEIHGSGEIPLEVVDAGDDADPAEVADTVWRRDLRRDYDFVSEWPVRIAVIRHRGVLTHRSWVMCHLVTDGAGSRVILDELPGRDTAGSRTALSPLEQARWQRSPAGLRLCDAAMRYWEKVLRTMPVRRFPARTERPYPRYWQGRLDSPALYLATRLISDRTGVEVASVLVALFTVSLLRVTGIHPVVFQLNSSNRFRPGLARSVSPIMQNSLFAIDVPDTTVDEAVALVRRRAMTAYKYAYYDPARREELLDRVGRDRGEPVDIHCSFNDRRLTPRAEIDPPTPEQVRAAVAKGTFEWQHQQDEVEFLQFGLDVDDVPDTIQLTVTTDIHQVSPGDAEACLRGMEEIAVAAAFDPATRTGAQ